MIDPKHRILNDVLEKFLSDDHMSSFFGLTKDEIKEALNDVRVSTEGLSVSPQFKSPGYGGNWTQKPMIVLSDLTNPLSVWCHECRHLLHYTLCKKIFIDPKYFALAIRLFELNVLGDPEFLTSIMQGGAETQKQLLSLSYVVLQTVKALDESPAEITVLTQFASIFGALTYQHAYFVDAGMCEAVASNGDTGFLAINDHYNRLIGTVIPGRQYLDGYKNTEDQNTFAAANMVGKALLVTKHDYWVDRNLYWQSAKGGVSEQTHS
jgi:hypothetical protein